MKQLRMYCRLNKTQWAILGVLAVIGIYLLMNAGPYKKEWDNNLNPLQLGFLQEGEYTIEITYEDSPEGNRILVWSDEMADAYNQMGLLLAEQEIKGGSGVVHVPLSLEHPAYGVRVRTMLDEEDAGYLAKVLIQSNHLVYKDNYVLGAVVILTGVLLAVWFGRMNRSLASDGVWPWQKMFLGYPEKYSMPLVLAGLGLLASLPLLSDALLWGDDTAFHLVRLEGIYQGIRTGDFPVRITPQQMEGYGSLTAAMYPQLFLYPVALLRFLGVSLMVSYKILLVLINIATAFGAYYAAANVCESRKIGLWMSILYTFSVYRLSNIYVRGALGEGLAMVFLPLVIWGVYEVLWGKGRWMILVLGMTGMLESHVLSTQLCVLFMGAELVFWLCSRKKQQFGKRFWNGCKAVLVTVLLNASFLLPFLYFCGEDFQCFHMPLETFEHAAYFSQLFSLFPSVGGASLGLGTTQHEMPITIGGVLLAGVILFLFLLGKSGGSQSEGNSQLEGNDSGRTEGKGNSQPGSDDSGWTEGKGNSQPGSNGSGRSEGNGSRRGWQGAGMHCFVYGGIAILMSSWLFPGEKLVQWEALRSFFTTLQFSWRFLGPATVCWSLTAAIGIVGVSEGAFEHCLRQDVDADEEKRTGRIHGEGEGTGGRRMIYGMMAVLVAAASFYFFDQLAQEREQRADKMELEGMSNGDGMYLYRDSEKFRAIQLDYHRREAVIRTDQGGGMKYADYRKEGSHIHVEVTPVGKGADILLFPLYWFPGYEITVNGESVPVFPQDTLVACRAPVEKAVIEVRYGGFPAFRAADIVTLVTFCSILGGMFYVRRKASG